MTKAPDSIDKAIAAAKDVSVKFDLATGRKAMIALPHDVTDFELLSAMAAIIQIGDQLRAARPKHGLQIVRTALPS